MLCPSCKAEMRITGKYLSFTGDKSPDTETKAYIKLQLECKNPKCSNRPPVYVTNPLEG